MADAMRSYYKLSTLCRSLSLSLYGERRLRWWRDALFQCKRAGRDIEMDFGPLGCDFGLSERFWAEFRDRYVML